MGQPSCLEERFWQYSKRKGPEKGKSFQGVAGVDHSLEKRAGEVGLANQAMELKLYFTSKCYKKPLEVFKQGVIESGLHLQL